MLRRIRHSFLCFPRRRCDCDDDSDSSGAQPNRPREITPKRALRQPLPTNVVRGAAPANQPQAGSEGEDSSEYEYSSDDDYPPAPPPSEVPLSDEVSHTGITPPMSETNLDDDSSSGDDPYSLSTRNHHTDSPPEVSDTDSNESSSSGDSYSAATRNSHTGITPEMSDTSLSESQYESFPESGESSLFVSAGEYNTDEEYYNGADEGSLDLNQDDDDEMYEEEDYNGADEGSLDLNQDDDEEMYEDPGESEEPETSGHEWPSDSSDRRRRRSLDNQAQADAEHRGLYGSRGSSASSKRQRLEGSADTSSGRVKTGLEPTTKDVTRYRNIGAQYQAWIDNSQAPGCRIKPATLTIEEMTDEAQPIPWKVDESYFTVEPILLEGGDVESMNIARGGPRWRYTHLRRDPGPNAIEANEFEHRVARGVLVAERIHREDGPHWNEVARAQYLLDFNLKTLRHVIFTDVGNEETAPYICHELYPRMGVMWSQAQNVDCMVFKHGSAEYQELLGTKLGKAVACLILSSFPRGTMRITRIVTWCNSTAPQMRFEIEPVIAPPVAFATAA